MPPYEDDRMDLPDDAPIGRTFVSTRPLAISGEAIVAAGVTQDLLAIQGAVENRLSQRVNVSTREGVHPSVVDVPDRNCLGVAIAMGAPESPRPRRATRTALRRGPRLILFLIEPEPPARAAARALRAAGIARSEIARLPVEVVVTGIIRAHAFDARMRPAPGGVSIAHSRSTAGTLGCLCTGRSAPRRGRLFILSNSHILANCNAGREGDCCSQQGPADGGVCPADAVASLERFVEIDFSGGPNHVDAATAETNGTLARPEMVFFQNGEFRFFRVSSTPEAATETMLVGKSGRTTQLRTGRVMSVNATTIATYDECQGNAIFRNQIAIAGIAPKTFSEAGDSGALVWTWTPEKRPVGLLFSGGGETSFANHISDVLDALDVDLVTQ